MQKCVNELVRHFKPTTNEVEVYCRFYNRWMNCNLGECSQTCEQYYRGPESEVEYIYKIELEDFKTDGKYHYNVLCREKLNALDTWKVCACGDYDTIEDCFNSANYWCEIFKGKRGR